MFFSRKTNFFTEIFFLFLLNLLLLLLLLLLYQYLFGKDIITQIVFIYIVDVIIQIVKLVTLKSILLPQFLLIL